MFLRRSTPEGKEDADEDEEKNQSSGNGNGDEDNDANGEEVCYRENEVRYNRTRQATSSHLRFAVKLKFGCE
jgi:hypothetical protein